MCAVVVVLTSTVVVFLATDAQAQSTVGDSCSELCGKYEDELEKCTEYQRALAGQNNRISQELSEKDEGLRIANDKLQRREKCENRPTEQENCTTQGSRKGKSNVFENFHSSNIFVTTKVLLDI